MSIARYKVKSIKYVQYNAKLSHICLHNVIMVGTFFQFAVYQVRLLEWKKRDKGMVPINLNNFMNTINKTIVKRGNKYYEEGYVNHLRQYEEYKYSAMVHGTTTYYVDVVLTDQNEIIKSSCTCPYQQGEYCKHQVAVFYELLKGKPKKQDRSVKAKKKTLNNNFQMVYNDTTNEELTAAKNILLLHIRKGKKQGFINYYHMPEVIRGFFTVIDQMEDKLKQADYEGCVRLGLIVLQLILDVSGYCDDSDGGVSDVVYHTIELIHKATEAGAHIWNPVQKQTIFELLLKESQEGYYSDMNEWEYKLLRSSVPLCDLLGNSTILETHVKQLLRREHNSPWVDQYDIEDLLLIQYELIERNDDRETVNKFIENHLEYHRFRV